MKKVLLGIWIAAIAAFALDWAMVGLDLLQGDYAITGKVYFGLVCVVVMLASGILYKAHSWRCPHCGKVTLSEGKYCPHCGREIEEKRRR